MPIAVPSSSTAQELLEIPVLRRSTVQACRFSSWYPVFRRRAIRGEVYKFNAEEEAEFRAWHDEDGMRLPDGVDEVDNSQLSDSDDESDASNPSSSSSAPPAAHSFPALTSLVKSALSEPRSAVFPKLSGVAPQDAQWILPLSQPMKCTTAEDVYMAVKASGLLNGVLEASLLAGLPAEERGELAEGQDAPPAEAGEAEQSIDGVVEDLSEEALAGERLELVIKKWYDMDRSREFRLFVRNDILLGMSQRDSNHYPHLLAADMQSRIRTTLQRFFDETLCSKFAGGPNFVVDVYLNSALDSAHIVDISPYHPFHTSGFLFDYSELHSLYLTAVSTPSCTEDGTIDLKPDALPVLRIIEDRMHPAAARNAPAYPAYPVDVNMVGGGRDIEEFKRVWELEVAKAAIDGDP